MVFDEKRFLSMIQSNQKTKYAVRDEYTFLENENV